MTGILHVCMHAADLLFAGAEQVHAFINEATDTNDRMNEKAKSLLGDDYGRDLAGVQALLRRHEELERDLTVIENKLEVRKIVLERDCYFLTE